MNFNEDIVVYFDADGVHADYDGGIKQYGFNIDPNLKHELNRSGSDNPLKREMYNAIRGTDFYYRLPILPGAIELWRRCVEYDPIVLTAAPKFGADEDNYFLNPYWLGAAYNKRRWFEEVFLPKVFPRFLGHETPPPDIYVPARVPLKDENFICTTSARKQEFMHRKHGPHQVLFDDRELNCFNWAKAGGFAVLYRNAEEAITALDWYEEFGDRMRANGLPDGGGMVWGLKPYDSDPLLYDVTFVRPGAEFERTMV